MARISQTRRTHPARMRGVVVPPKLYRIGEITRHTGLSRQTIHNYTTMGLIRETERTPGGHRLYDEQVFHLLHYIAGLKPTATMQEIRQQIAHQHPPS